MDLLIVTLGNTPTVLKISSAFSSGVVTMIKNIVNHFFLYLLAWLFFNQPKSSHVVNLKSQKSQVNFLVLVLIYIYLYGQSLIYIFCLLQVSESSINCFFSETAKFYPRCIHIFKLITWGTKQVIDCYKQFFSLVLACVRILTLACEWRFNKTKKCSKERKNIAFYLEYSWNPNTIYSYDDKEVWRSVKESLYHNLIDIPLLFISQTFPKAGVLLSKALISEHNSLQGEQFVAWIYSGYSQLIQSRILDCLQDLWYWERPWNEKYLKLVYMLL